MHMYIGLKYIIYKNNVENIQCFFPQKNTKNVYIHTFSESIKTILKR